MESNANPAQPRAYVIRLTSQLLQAKELVKSAERRAQEAEGAKDLLRCALEETTSDLKSARERVRELEGGAELSQELAQWVLTCCG